MTGAIIAAFVVGMVFGIFVGVASPIYGMLRDQRAMKKRISQETLMVIAGLRKASRKAGGE